MEEKKKYQINNQKLIVLYTVMEVSSLQNEEVLLRRVELLNRSRQEEKGRIGDMEGSIERGASEESSEE